MLTYLIPIVGIIIGFAGIVYILIKKARDLSGSKKDELVYPKIEPEAKTEETVHGEVSDGGSMAEHTLLVTVEKFFRKARIKLMRLENWLGKITNKLHERSLRKKSFFVEEEGTNAAEDSSTKKSATLIALNQKDEKFDEDYWINILKHDTSSAYPYKKLGEIYIAREDFKEARAVLNYALKLDRADEEAKAMLESLKGKRTRRKTQSA